MTIKVPKAIYLDHASATPLDESVLRVIDSWQKKFYANPSSIHALGVEVANSISISRAQIASLMNAHPDEIIFTGSGTESDALAILGVSHSYNLKYGKVPHIITSQIEHSAVLENCKMLEREGRAEVTYVGVDARGIVDIEEIKKSLKDNTSLVSVMYANNEIGTIQPIMEIAKTIRHFKKSKILNSSDSNSVFPIFHTDACQAMNYLFTENIEKLGVDLMSFNSSKIYGPKGVGVLFKKRGINLEPLYQGGGQELGLRSGTENVALIAGTALAFEIANKVKNKEVVRLTKIRDYAISKILALNDDKILVSKNTEDTQKRFQIILNGDKDLRLPNNINISVSGISSELLVIELSAKGIMVSEKSACKSDDPGESYVISALRQAQEESQTPPQSSEGSLRISLGRETKKVDMDILVKCLKDILNKYVKFS